MAAKALKEQARELVCRDDALRESVLQYPPHFCRGLGISPAKNIVEVVLGGHPMAEFDQVRQWYKERGLYNDATHKACLDAAE